MAKLKTPEYMRRAQKRYMETKDHISVNLPVGTKDRIKELTGESVNGFINRLVLAELDRLEAENQ